MITSRVRLDAEAKELLAKEETQEKLAGLREDLAKIKASPKPAENEHIDYALYAASTIMAYPHEEQNEILARIFDTVLSNRIRELEVARNQVSLIVESLEGLKKINADHPNNL